MKDFERWLCKRARFCLVFALLLFSNALLAQDGAQEDTVADIRAVPILTGSAAHFTSVTGGTVRDVPSISPLLLLPLGDKWLVEAKGISADTFAKDAQGDYAGTFSYGMAYASADYIANRYVTVSAGRFATPFGIYGERLAPNWIRALQTTPLTSPIISGSSLGGMVRGGIPSRSEKVDFTYAAYFSAANTNHIVATDRSTGGRFGLFLPGPRLEIGASYQQVLQADRPHSAGTFFEWQPNPVPLTLRSEYVRSSGLKGSAYWVESVYRLTQIPYMHRLEVVGRGQQFFAAANLSPAAVKRLGALGRDTQEADGGLNYYFSGDVRASASYGRQLAQGHNANIWVIGMTYRFVMPLMPTGSVR